jgi:hypothetical protein
MRLGPRAPLAAALAAILAVPGRARGDEPPPQTQPPPQPQPPSQPAEPPPPQQQQQQQEEEPLLLPVSGQIGGAKPGPDTSAIPHYDKGFVLVPTLDPVKVPYRLRLNHVSQFRYTNSLDVDHTYTTHLGVVKQVLRRNDIELTRDVFYFSGFAFDPRMDFNILVYTSSATLSATAAGFVGFVFSRAFALRAGFFSLPSVRSLTGSYPFFQSTDRSMANNYVRPGFTQGVWANGELFRGFNYIAMVGNSLNTLDIAATRIDNQFAYSLSIWYDVNNFSKEWSDFEYHERPALRLGTAFTYAREDRLSDLSTASPENNSIFISDGQLLFETGALATGVTISLANYYLSAVDAGIKFRGIAFNTEFYFRWLNDFTADGPLPITSMFDWGFEASLAYFIVPHFFETYGRGSMIKGPFATPFEGALGFNFYPFHTRGVWLNAEAIVIQKSPYQSVLYVYSSGQTGSLYQMQFLVRF